MKGSRFERAFEFQARSTRAECSLRSSAYLWCYEASECRFRLPV